MRSPNPHVKVSSGRKPSPMGAAITARQPGQTALSAARNRAKVREPNSTSPRAEGTALRAAPPASSSE
eukprot:5414794-Alexandrium_andersonii.AAC.1